MSTPKTAPDFGEPWQAIGNHLYDRCEYQKAQFSYGENAERAAICVTACSGLLDPAAEIQALRLALAKARRCAEEWREHCLKRHTMSQIVSSKLPWEEKE